MKNRMVLPSAVTVGRVRTSAKGPHTTIKLNRATAMLGAAVLLAACNTETVVETVSDEANDRLAITNNQQKLDQRISHSYLDVPIDGPVVTIQGQSKSEMPGAVEKAVDVTIRMRLVAEISPPVVNGQTVQATSIAMDGGDKAMVSYNMVGAPRLGAVDWITELKKLRPTIRSSITFNDSDINAVGTDGRYVYSVAASNDPALTYPAVFERIRLKNDKFTLADNERIPLASFAGTGVMRAGSEIYVTSGSAGEVVAFGKSDLDLLGAFPLHDARWVAWDKDNKRIVVVQGTPGQISVFEEGEFANGSMNLLNTFPFSGADIPESKSTVDVAGSRAFIAAGTQGVQIMCLDDGSIVGSIPLPDAAALGLDPADVVTNAVAVDKNVMFMSNGGAGVYVAASNDDLKDAECNEQQEIEVIGQLQIGGSASVNHVAFKNDHLFVAAGLGGVKVIEVDIDD